MMDAFGPDPPVRLTPLTPEPDSSVTSAGSEQGPLVPHPQNYGCQVHGNVDQANLIQQQGQTTAQQQWQIWQQEQYLIGQNQRLPQNQNEVYVSSQQPNFNPNFSRPAVSYSQDYVGQPHLGNPSTNLTQQEWHTTALPTLQQQWHQQQYSMSGQISPLSSNQNEVFVPFQQQNLTQQITNTSRPAVSYSQDYVGQPHLGIPTANLTQKEGHTPALPNLQQQWHPQQYSMSGQTGPLPSNQNEVFMPFQQQSLNQQITNTSSFDSRNIIQHLEQTTVQPTSNQQQQQRQQQLQYQQQLLNEQMAPHENEAYMSNEQPYIIKELRTSSRNMPVSPAGPMGNMPDSPVDPMGNMSASPTSHLGNMSTSPSRPIGSQSTSSTDCMGNDHSILHDINQSRLQPLDAIYDSCSPFPSMAEKRSNNESIWENGNIILAKRPKTNVDTDSLCTSVSNQDLSGDETGRLDSGNNKDPLSGLTREQRVVLYTLFLCQGILGSVYSSNCADVIDICIPFSYQDLEGDVYMRKADYAGDIDVMTIVKELENKKLLEHINNQYTRIPGDKQSMIMKSYRENCLLSEIDKDFFVQVALDASIKTYAGMYCRHGDGPRESEDIGPITAMRLIVEGHGKWLPDSLQDEFPACFINDKKEVEMFVKFWCNARDTDPITFSDQIPDEKVKNFYSAFTILSEIKNGVTSFSI